MFFDLLSDCVANRFESRFHILTCRKLLMLKFALALGDTHSSVALHPGPFIGASTVQLCVYCCHTSSYYLHSCAYFFSTECILSSVFGSFWSRRAFCAGLFLNVCLVYCSVHIVCSKIRFCAFVSEISGHSCTKHLCESSIVLVVL